MDIAPFRREVVSAALAVREKAPLVHNITNYVVMQVSANVLLAAGASPLMAHAPEELDDLLAVASALVLNIGTPDQAWLDSMFLAGECAARRSGCVVSISGETDYITDGDIVLAVRGGSPLMSRVTGMGCSASALTAAHVAVAGTPLAGAAAAMAVMAEAGEAAARLAEGPGSFLSRFLDALYLLDARHLEQRVFPA